MAPNCWREEKTSAPARGTLPRAQAAGVGFSGRLAAALMIHRVASFIIKIEFYRRGACRRLSGILAAALMIHGVAYFTTKIELPRESSASSEK
jgi:hypothetical protein